MKTAELMEAAFRLRVAMEQGLYAAKALKSAGQEAAAVDVALAVDRMKSASERVTTLVGSLIERSRAQ